MAQQHQLTAVVPSSPKITNGYARRSMGEADGEDDDARTVHGEETKRPNLAQKDSDQVTATEKQIPLMTTNTPWYNMDLLSIGKKSQILDPRDYSMFKKSTILLVVAIAGTMYVYIFSICYHQVFFIFIFCCC